jgi:L-lactate dehydrogenase complex protein LldF
MHFCPGPARRAAGARDEDPADRPVRGVAPGCGDPRAVYDGSKIGHEKRTKLLFDHYGRPDRLRALAGEIKQHVVENLDTYLPAVEARLAANGVKVHWASTAESACEAVHSILKARGATKLVKAKTMVSEEIELDAYLRERGIESSRRTSGNSSSSWTTTTPSHIVKPIIHKNRRQIAELFEKNGLGAYNDEPGSSRSGPGSSCATSTSGPTPASRAPTSWWRRAGRLVVVTNEGNSRFCLAATRCHIALVGIEKILPKDRDLALLLNLLARSATAQQLTVYNEFILGPRGAGPAGRPRRDACHLRRQRPHGRPRERLPGHPALHPLRRLPERVPGVPPGGGHAYRSVYPGPVGAVLSPLLLGKRIPGEGRPAQGLEPLRGLQRGVPGRHPDPRPAAAAARQGAHRGRPVAGNAADGRVGDPRDPAGRLEGGPRGRRILNHLPTSLIPVPALRAWESKRELPPWRGGEFRKWLKMRRKKPKFEPFILPETVMREFTVRALITGTVLGHPVRRLVALPRPQGGPHGQRLDPGGGHLARDVPRCSRRSGFRDATILENNITQTAGSAGESLAFGVGVTMPAIMILGFDLDLTRVLLVSVLGGLLGILMMIPLRRALIVKEHGILKYPEGTACAAVLTAGASADGPGDGLARRHRRDARGRGRRPRKGPGAKAIFTGLGVGIVYNVLNRVARLWKDTPEKIFGAPFNGASVSAEISPELLGIGYIIGPRIAALMCGGGVLSYLVLIPMIKFFGEHITGAVAPGKIPIADMESGRRPRRLHPLHRLRVPSPPAGSSACSARSPPSGTGSRRACATWACSRPRRRTTGPVPARTGTSR